jgi:hypothetical protein
MALKRLLVSGVLGCILLVPVSIAVTAAEASAAAATSGHCAPVSGVQWALPYAPNTKGTSYNVSVVKYNCASAHAYVRTLVKEKVHSKLSGTIRGGPSGWHCTGSPSKTGLAYTGECAKNRFNLNGASFEWTVG